MNTHWLLSSSLGQVRDAVVDTFDVDPDEAWQDVSLLLCSLTERRLVEQVR